MSDNKSLVARIAEKYGVDSQKFYDSLKATAFKQRDGSAPTNEQMMALLVVADQYGLNPFTKEIYAFPDKQNGIIPVVGVDGWCRIINEHSQYDGVEFEYSDKMILMPGSKVECPEWIETVMYRKDRARPIKIREFLDEVYREPFQGKGRNGPYTIEGPWQTHTKRQLRHKSFIQCARIAFGFVGIFDQDEAERIRDMGHAEVVPMVTPAITPNNDQPVKQVDCQRLDPILEKLANRASEQAAWGAALQYVNERFKGSEKEYAIQFLNDKESELIAQTHVDEESSELELLSTQDEEKTPQNMPEFSDEEDGSFH